MPDRWRQLKPGDRIRMIALPAADLRAYESGANHLKETLDLLRKAISERCMLTVDQVDEYGHPWVGYSFTNSAGKIEEHTFTICDDASWELA